MLHIKKNECCAFCDFGKTQPGSFIGFHNKLWGLTLVWLSGLYLLRITARGLSATHIPFHEAHLSGRIFFPTGFVL